VAVEPRRLVAAVGPRRLAAVAALRRLVVAVALLLLAAAVVGRHGGPSARRHRIVMLGGSAQSVPVEHLAVARSKQSRS
jgi:hypothetical protein